jgi:hypothetical protein
MGEQTSEEGYKISSYNSSELKNIYLHELWKSAGNAMVAGLYEKWNSYLDLIFGELIGDITDGGENEYKIYNNLIINLNTTGSLKISEIRGFNKVTNGNKDSQYRILFSKHVWLKQLQTKLNRGTKFKDEFEDSID